MNEIKNYLSDLTILFVDDEDGVRESFEALLNMWCKKAYSASNGKEGLKAYHKYNPDIIITDIKMPVMSGLEMAEHIKKTNPNLPIIITTAFQESELLLEAVDLHVDAYIVKPIPKKELKKRLDAIAKVLLIEKELKKANELNRLYLATSGAFMVALDKNANITMLNKAACETLGLNQNETIGKNWFEIGVIPQENIDEMKTYFFKLVLGEIELSNQKLEHELISKDGEHFIFTWVNVCLKENNDTIGVLSSGLDITQQHMLEQLLREQTYIDALTNVHNRKSYDEKIKELFSLYDRYEKAYSMLMYDIDYFKKVNDTYGHDIGDKVLIEMSQLVQLHVRENDYLFRIGGEEFIVLFSETTLNDAKIIAEKIRSIIENHLFTPKNLKITVSIGLTEVKKGDNVDIIFKRVDSLLYKSKNNGRNMISY